MSDQWIRCNLAAAKFPFATPFWGRSIIMPQFDQNYDRVSAAYNKDDDKGIPQAFYMHNVVPTREGYQAISWDRQISAIAANDFDTVHTLEYSAPNFAKILWSPSQGKNYIYDAVTGAWVSRSPVSGVKATALETSALINGVSYIYYEKTGCFKYDTVAKTFGAQVLTGLDTTVVKGICTANGYLIAWDDTNVAWSSATDPTNFTPDITTGAGGGAIQFAKGKLKFAVPISGGFMVYCEQNTVSATYSGNIRFPFIFAEVPGSGGCDDPDKVSYASNLATHYAWTTAGIQELSKTIATINNPEITDFLNRLVFEDFNVLTLLFTETNLSSMVSVKVNVIGDRYLVISYGVSSPDFTHAIMFDLALKRYGKFKVNHRKCFEWPVPNVYGNLLYGDLVNVTYGQLSGATYGDLTTSVSTIEQPAKNIAFLQKDGTVYTVNMDFAQNNINVPVNGVFINPIPGPNPPDVPVLVLGKFQFERNYFIFHQLSDIENVGQNNNFLFYILPSIDGKTFLPAVPGILSYTSAYSRKYAKRVAGLNISALFIGAFNLNTYMLNFTLGGSR